MEYKLIDFSHGYIDNFNKTINKYLQNGWMLYGAPFANEYSIFQAMTRKKDD